MLGTKEAMVDGKKSEADWAYTIIEEKGGRFSTAT